LRLSWPALAGDPYAVFAAPVAAGPYERLGKLPRTRRRLSGWCLRAPEATASSALKHASSRDAATLVTPSVSIQLVF
jgi:hypothetical protein